MKPESLFEPIRKIRARAFPCVVSILLSVAACFALSLRGPPWWACLKQSDLIVVGAVTNVEIVPVPAGSNQISAITSQSRLTVRVSEVLVRNTNDISDVLAVDYGYNASLDGERKWLGKRAIFVLQQVTNAQGKVIGGFSSGFRYSWAVGYDTNDAARLLELRSALRSGIDPKNLTNGIPRPISVWR